MKRRPRKYGEPMLSLRSIGKSIVQGVIGLAIALAVYLAVYLGSGNGDNARALAFTSLVLVNLAMIISNRSLHLPIYKRFGLRNKVFIVLSLMVLGFLGLVLYVPFIRELFKFELLHPLDILVCIGAGALALTFFELLKMAGGKRAPAK
jgi:Ca2+-transporting ATPase